MKAKILGFFCSLLILNFGYGQTIDGKLYTQFNNWYKWRGGGFDSTLLLPQDSAATGKRPGAVYYRSSDSSVYSWSGTQWVKVGGSNLTFSNGLTKSGDNVKLGGTLTENTTIKGSNARSLTIDSLSSFLVRTDDNIQGYKLWHKNVSFFGTNPSINQTYITTPISSTVSIDLSGTSLTLSRALTNSITLRSDTAQIVGRMSYLLDPSSGFTRYSLIHKQYVDNLAVDSVFIQNDSIKYRKNGVSIASTPADTATVVKAYVTNAEAVTITKGQVVYIFGASGDRAAVKLAKNTSDTFSSKTLGIVREDIAAGQAGWVTTQGQVSGINLGAYTAGDILWLDSVPGGFTKVKPVSPLHGVFVGVVERANPGNGLIYVKPQNGVEVDEIHDILITNKKIGDGIIYTGSLFENKQVNLKQDTVPLAVFNVGSAAAGDTAAFSTSTLAGSFYLDGTDTMFVTSYRVALQGTSASITPDVWFNDSLNVTAGGTKLVNSPSAITNLTTGTSVTATTNRIPPGNFVFVRFSAVTTKPTYFTLTLFGYRIRKQ